jgi:hypothetical protein
MTTSPRVGRLTVIEVTVAGTVMILAAASVAAFALAGSAGGSVAITPASAGALALAVGLAGAGVESIRRRHFLFAVLVPALMAMVNLGYVIATSQWTALGSVAVFVFVVVLVASGRPAFRD